MAKIFCFDASSFTVEPSIESFLRANGALRMDFGNSAYIDSEKMPQILSGLVSETNYRASIENSTKELQAKLESLNAEYGKLVGVNDNLSSKVGSQSIEIGSLKEQLSSVLKTVENLEAEQTRLQLAVKSAAPATSDTGHPSDASLKQSNDKLRKELEQVRGEGIEAITSLKVLEDENDGLRKELEHLRGQLKAPTTPNAT